MVDFVFMVYIMVKISLIVDTDQCYLETEEGRKFIPVFQCIRWHHVVNDMSSIKMIENDKVMPIGEKGWT